MQFTQIVLAALAGFATAAPAVVERQANNDVVPWQITAVSAFKPSGRPNSSPGSKLSVTLVNDNQYKLQKVPRGYAVFPKFTATCEWNWEAAKETLPYGVETVCTPTTPDSMYGNLTMTLSPGSGESLQPHGNFKIAIKEFRTVTVFQLEYIRVWEGAASFTTGDNLKQICGAGGACNWSLKNGPVSVKQELTKSVGRCEDSSVGGC